MLISPLVADYPMNPMLDAAIWFWIPLCLVPIGIWLTISGKAKLPGKIIAATGLILVMISSWTVPDSDSSAGGHLILTIFAPTILLAYGIHGMVFGGNVPVLLLLSRLVRVSNSLRVSKCRSPKYIVIVSFFGVSV